MSDPYVGEIRMFAGNFAPAGWAFCNGQLLPIDENPVLFQLLGTTYGGDGQTNFALPNLQSRLPVAVGPGFALGQAAGAETVTLTTSQITAHSHSFQATPNNGTTVNPAGNAPARFVGNNVYLPATPNVAMAPGSIGPVGGGQPHDNMHPFQVISFIISLFGAFPSQT